MNHSSPGRFARGPVPASIAWPSGTAPVDKPMQNFRIFKELSSASAPGVRPPDWSARDATANQTMIGSRVTGSKVLPRLTTLGSTLSAGPRSSRIRWSSLW